MAPAGERAGQAPRVPVLDQTLNTVVACGVKHAIAAAARVQPSNADKPGSPPRRGDSPIPSERLAWVKL
ncbi:hypothetical protein FEZ21_16265 [Pseudomonas sp. 9.1(2019)]|nr:hypothetical protein [Pseudomonas sp. 9.1(2019)]